MKISQFVRRLLYEELEATMDDYNSRPVPLIHPELGTSQILFGVEMNLTGSFEFDDIATVPRLLVSCFPGNLKLVLPGVD